MPTRMDEILVRRLPREFMAHAPLNQHSVDRADLNAHTAARSAHLCGRDVVRSIRLDERQCTTPIDDGLSRSRSGKSLQEFLKHRPGHDDRISATQRFEKKPNLRTRSRVHTRRAETFGFRSETGLHTLQFR